MKTLKTLALAAAATFAGATFATAQEANTTADVNMRAGPGSRYPVVTTVPEDREVYIHGCLADFEWCDVSWRRQRGWVFSDYLEGIYGQSYVPFYEYRRRTSLPVITFGFNYWDRNYRDRPWFDDWDRWGGRDRDRDRDRDRVRDRDRDRDRDGNQARDRDRDDDRDDDNRNRVRDRDRDGNQARDRNRDDDGDDDNRTRVRDRNRDGDQAGDRNRNTERGTERNRNRTRGNDDGENRRGGDDCDGASQDPRCNNTGQQRSGPGSIVDDEDMMP